MIILCTGMPRSGSTWSYNVCKTILQAAFPGSSLWTGYCEEVGRVVEDHRQDTDHLLIKCHNLADAGSRHYIERNQPKLVYTYRDPRSAVASGMVVFGHSFEHMVALVLGSLQFMDYQMNVANPLLISYGELSTASMATIRRILRYLGIEIADDAIREIGRRCGRREMTRIAAQIDSLDPHEVQRDGQYVMHRPTLIHRNHLREEGAAWHGVLSDAQARHVIEVTRRWEHRWLSERGALAHLVRRVRSSLPSRSAALRA